METKNIKTNDNEIDNRIVEKQFRLLLEDYNQTFASLIYDKTHRAYIISLKTEPEEEQCFGRENTYEIKVYKNAPKGELRSENQIGEAELYSFNKDELTIERIHINKQWQNRGIGKATLKKIEEFAKTKGFVKLRLDCLKRTVINKETGLMFNANYKIYSSIGFHKKAKKQTEDSYFIEMEKNISKDIQK